MTQQSKGTKKVKATLPKHERELPQRDVGRCTGEHMLHWGRECASPGSPHSCPPPPAPTVFGQTELVMEFQRAEHPTQASHQID